MKELADIVKRNETWTRAKPNYAKRVPTNASQAAHDRAFLLAYIGVLEIMLKRAEGFPG
jgi:hypothetical protein